jgi:hypothetical protein
MDADAIMKLIATLAIALVTGFILPWMKTKMDAGQYEKTQALVMTLVQAAEQRYGQGASDAKRAWVEDTLKAQGVDAEQYGHLIEASVLKMHAKGLNWANVHGDGEELSASVPAAAEAAGNGQG